MKCPTDGTTLTMTDRQGIEIDYCPECRGVWLDRGELDKLIERAAPADTGRSDRDRNDDRDRDRDRDDDRWKYDDRSKDGYRSGDKKRKKSGFLGELFEF